MQSVGTIKNVILRKSHVREEVIKKILLRENKKAFNNK